MDDACPRRHRSGGGSFLTSFYGTGGTEFPRKAETTVDQDLRQNGPVRTVLGQLKLRAHFFCRPTLRAGFMLISPGQIAHHEICPRICRSHLSTHAAEWDVHCLQSEASRRAGTAAEVVERVVRFVVRSTTD